MSFFQEERSDSNLQYDDAAFIFFIASVLVVAAIIFLILIIQHLKKLSIPNSDKIIQAPYLHKKLHNLKQYKRQQLLNKWLLFKVITFIILLIVIAVIYQNTKSFKGNLKGFNPYEILGVKEGATLKQIKKAYRQLARQFHPDKNYGNPQAQSKFILISKSYECFANQAKRQNCFKYGNPDGAQTFRVGIGLPAIFIKLEYQWVILPIILILCLVIIPLLALKWSIKEFVKDPNGISILGMSKLFKCLDESCSKFTVIALLSSYKETYEYLGYGPISQENKDKLFTQLSKYPNSRKSFVQDFTDEQLYIYWQIYQYMTGMGEFTHPEFRQIVEQYIVLSLQAVRIFCIKQNDGVELYGNPEWKIVYLGIKPIEAFGQFSRDYYNRTLGVEHTPTIWLRNLDLTDQQRLLAQKANIGKINLFLTLKNKAYEPIVKLFAPQRQNIIKNQLQNFPIYHIESKFKINNKQVTSLTKFDYGQIWIKVSRLNKTNGYVVAANYPFPRKQKLLLMAVMNQNVIFQQYIQFKNQKDYYITKIDFRSGAREAEVNSIMFYAISDTYHLLDVNCNMVINARAATPQQNSRKVVFHKDDVNLEKLGQKSIFEEMMDLHLDPQQNMLSESDQSEQAQDDKAED